MSQVRDVASAHGCSDASDREVLYFQSVQYSTDAAAVYANTVCID